jgi:hypothetical protein
MDLINPTPTLALPLKGREIVTCFGFFLPLQGGGQEGDGVVTKGVRTNETRT